MSGSEGDGTAEGPRSSRARSGGVARPGRKGRARGWRVGDASSTRTDLVLALALWGLAYLHRALFLFSNVDRNWGFTVFYEGDSETFYDFARAILAGVPYDSGIPFHPPLWPHLLAWIHVLVGAGSVQAEVPHVEVKLWTAAIGASVVPLLFLLAQRYLGRGVALVSALVATYSFGLYVVSVAPVTESLFMVLLLSSLLVMSTMDHPLAPWSTDRRLPVQRQASRYRTWMKATGLGILLGLLCLTRAEGVLPAMLVIGLGIVGAERGRFVTNRLPWIVGLAAAVLVIAPWTVRNSRALEAVNLRFASRMAEPLPTFVPITAYGPLNFALANNELAEGPFSRSILTSQADSATLDVTDPQHLEYFLHGYRIGIDWIRSQPGDFARLVLRKWRLFFGAGTLGFTQWDVPGGLDGVRRPVDLFVPNSRRGGWILFPLVILGCVQLLRAGGAPRRWALLGLLITGVGMVTAGLFFGYARLGVIALPLWISSAVAGIVATLQGVRRGFGSHDPLRSRMAAQHPRETPSGRQVRSPFDWTPRFLTVRERVAWLLPVFLLLTFEIWGATGERNFHATGTQAEGMSHLNPHDTMYLEVISGN